MKKGIEVGDFVQLIFDEPHFIRTGELKASVKRDIDAKKTIGIVVAIRNYPGVDYCDVLWQASVTTFTYSRSDLRLVNYEV